MDIEIIGFDIDRGWSQPLPPLDSEQTLILAFADRRFSDQPEPLRELARRYPRAAILGCSTAGEIRDGHIGDGGIAVAIARFRQTRLRAVCAPLAPDGDARSTGIALARMLTGPNLRAILVLSEGLRVNGSALVAGINTALPASVVVTGGLAADGERFGHTWVLGGGEARSGQVSAVGLYGDALRIGHGSRGGWKIFGPERRITRAVGNVLHELDGRPALALYRQYLGDLADALPASALRFPLAVRAGTDDQRRLVRTVLAVDDRQGSMTFAGDIPEGCLAQLMHANLDHLVDGAEEAAELARRRGGEHPGLAIAISCVGRRMVLGERSEEEIEATLESLPPETRQIGFYSYGELSPYETGSCDLHNQTMTLTTIAEAPAADSDDPAGY